MSLRALSDKKSILTIGEFKELDKTPVSANHSGDILSYEIIECDDSPITFDKDKIICREFIEVE